MPKRLKDLAEYVENQTQAEGVFTRQFLIALRMAVDSGLTYDEVVSAIMLHAGIRQMLDRTSTENLTDRVRRIVEVMSRTKR